MNEMREKEINAEIQSDNETKKKQNYSNMKNKLSEYE